MVLSGKETGWISRRSGVVIVSEVCRYICVVDGYRKGRLVKVNENEEGYKGRKLK